MNNDDDDDIYFKSLTLEVVAQSPKPGAHVKNARLFTKSKTTYITITLIS